MVTKLFFLVFKNKVLRKLIFSKVKHIHRDILLLKESKNEILKWHQLLDDVHLLAYYNYLNEVKQYHNNRIKNNQYGNRSILPIYTLNMINKFIENITRGDSVDVLQYIIDQQRDLIDITSIYALSVKYNSMKIFNYLESFKRNNNNNDSIIILIEKSKPSRISPRLSITYKIKWDYYHALSEVPVSGNMVLFKYLFDKVDIRNTLINNEFKYKEYTYIIKFIEASAEYGRTEMLDHIFGLFESDRYLLEDILIDNIPSILDKIIKNGNLNILKQCYNLDNTPIKNRLKGMDLLYTCVIYNQFEMMKYFHENQIESFASFHLMVEAASFGNLEMVKWLHENRTEGCATNAMDRSAENGHFEMVKWLHFNRTEGCTTNAMDLAAENGHFEIVKWLYENRTEGCTTTAMNMASGYGHLEIIKWLQENSTEGCTDFAMDNAAANGHLGTIKWLHFNRTEGCTDNAMNYAALNGHLETIKWLHHNRTEGCSTNAMDEAASNGHLETIKWLHHNRTEGCTTKAMDYATENEHLKIIKWLHENRTEVSTKSNE